jgi:hypothetical protein
MLPVQSLEKSLSAHLPDHDDYAEEERQEGQE